MWKYRKVSISQNHPLANDTGRARAHHVAWLDAGGRRLERNEVLHHVNGDATDNRPCNLAIMRRDEHSRHHARERMRARRVARLAGWVVDAKTGAVTFDECRRAEMMKNH